MPSMNQMKDVLTAYFINSEDVKNRSSYLKIDPELIAEMKADEFLETDDGVELYNSIMDILKGDYKRLSNN